MDCLLRLVEDPQILEAAWEREPVLTTGLDPLDDVLTLEGVDAMLARGYPLDAVRLVEDGRSVNTASLAAVGRYGRRSAERVTDGAAVARRVAAGATLILENLAARLPSVAAFAGAVSQATGYDTYCSAFLTPGGCRGVAPHHDTASVFVRQVSGSKRWRVARPGLRWPLREYRPQAHQQEVMGDLVLDVTLEPGDCLYLPRGFLHATEAGDDASLHLSMALRPVTWGLLFQRALAQVADECEEFREALPPSFAHADAEELFRERGALLAARLDDLASTAGVADLLRGQRPAPARPGALLDAVGARPGSRP
jgi:lysine-specific demethylase/histidyl-hydroxylase NO66